MKPSSYTTNTLAKLYIFSETTNYIQLHTKFVSTKWSTQRQQTFTFIHKPSENTKLDPQFNYTTAILLQQNFSSQWNTNTSEICMLMSVSSQQFFYNSSTNSVESKKKIYDKTIFTKIHPALWGITLYSLTYNFRNQSDTPWQMKFYTDCIQNENILIHSSNIHTFSEDNQLL